MEGRGSCRVGACTSWGGEGEGGGLQSKGRGHKKTRSIRKLKDKDEKPHQHTDIMMDPRVIRNNEGKKREERVALMIAEQADDMLMLTHRSQKNTDC